jgi:hypothetical protein
MPISLTSEQIAALQARLLQPKETEYKSAAGHRRSENHDIGDLLKVTFQLSALANPGPTFRRVGHSRGFRKNRGKK